MEIKGISFKTTASKKILAVVLSVLILLTAIPVGLVTSVKAAAANDCMAIEVAGKKVYFFGAETLETNEDESTVVHYTTSAQSDLAIYVDGKSEVDTTGVTVDMQENTIDFGTWLANQDKWVAVQLDDTKAVPTAEPNVEVDKTAPEITDVLGNPSDWTNKDVTLTVEAKDNDGGTGVVAYSKDRTNWQAEATFNITENGTYTFYVKDAVGNVSEVTEISVVDVEHIDKTAPKISVSYNPETWTKDTIEVTVTATDNESGIPETGAYSLDSESDWQDDNKFTISDNAEHTVYVKDNAGNIGSRIFTAVQYDDVAPTITNVKVTRANKEYKEKAWTSPDLDYDFKIIAEDDKSGVALYSSDGKNWDTNATLSLKGGQNKYTFYAKDAVGNVSNVYNFSLQADITSPTVSIKPDKTEKTNEFITYTITADDMESGLAEKPYRIDGNEWTDINAFDISDDKAHVVEIRDDAENITTKEIQAANFCSEEPKINGYNLNNENWTNEPVELSLTAEGNTNASGTEFKVDEYCMDGEWTKENKFTISDAKDHVFKVKNEAGTESEEITYSVANFDAEAPQLSTKEDDEDYKPIKFTQKNDGKIAAILNKLTFGRFFNKTLVITVDAEDVVDKDGTSNASGIIKAEFTFTDAKSNEYKFEAGTKEIGNKEAAKIQFPVKADELPDNFKGTASVTLTDAAGNGQTYQVTTNNSDIMGKLPPGSDSSFMIENNAPVVTSAKTDIVDVIELNEKESENFTDVNHSFKFSFTVDDTVDENGVPLDGEYSGIAAVNVKANGKNIFTHKYNGEDKKEKCKDPITECIYVNGYNSDDDADNYTIVCGTDECETEFTQDDWNDGVIEFEIAIVDNAGNARSYYYTFKFDQTAPVISKFEIVKDEDAKQVSVEDYGFFFKNKTTVNIYAKDIINTEEQEAFASGIESITVLMIDSDENPAVYTDTELKTDKEGETYTSVTVQAGFKGQIYAYATDKLGNKPSNCDSKHDTNKKMAVKIGEELYVHPDGTIIENNAQHLDKSAIEIKNSNKPVSQQSNTKKYSNTDNNVSPDKELSYDSTKNVPLYDKKAKFDVTVSDPVSGIKSIKYTLIENGKSSSAAVNVKTTKAADNKGNFKAATIEGGKQSISTGNEDQSGDAKEEWSVSSKITANDINIATEIKSQIEVDANYNDIVLQVELTDNAGNKSYDYVIFGIDRTAPEITVEYESSASPETNNYYNKTRSAYITIKERNITTQDVQLLIEKCTNMERDFSASDKTEYKNSFNIEKNKIKDGSGNRDDRTYRIKVNFDKDGNYRIKTLSCADTAGNKNKTIVYKKYGSASNKDDVTAKNRTLFTIDKTKPVINVSLDLNDQVHNKKYFNKTRTATITVTERNFDTSDKADFVNNITATLNGNTISKPVVSSFKRQGKTDKWVATVKFEADGDYTLAFNATDKAGNVYDVKKDTSGVFSGNAASDFTIDKTAPTVSITNALSNNHSYKDVPVIVLTEKDNNCSNITSSVEGTYYDADAKELKKISLKANSNGVLTADHRTQNEVKYSVVEEDGIYTITVSCVDLAGNKSDTKTLRFTKNAKGSVFVPSEDLSKLNNGYANSDNLSSNLVIDEYSANETENAEYYININGKQTDNKNIISRELVKDSDSANGGWYHYRYVINKNEIHAEGKYSVYIKSSVAIDKNNTIQNNASANDKLHRIDINFTIDNTNPYVKISGLDRHTYIKTEKVPVDFYITDSNLSYVKVWVYDSNGTVDENTVPTYTWNAYNEDNEKNNILDWTEKDGLIYVSFELPASDSSLNVKFEIADKAGNKCCKDSDFNKDEIFVTGVEEGQSAGFFEIGDNNAIVLKSISINKNLSLSAVASIIKDNIKLAVVIIVAVILVLAAIIILPIISKRRKKLDAEDEGLID